MFSLFLTKTLLVTGEGDPPDLGVPDLPPVDYGWAFFKVFATLILLGALLFATLWFLRKVFRDRMQRGSEHQLIQVLDRRMISPKTILYLVTVRGEEVLLAESQLEIRRLSEISKSAP